MAEPTFQFDAGSLCLDFANALAARLEPPADSVLAYADLVAWAVQAGVLAPGQGQRLLERARREREKAAAAVRRAAELRAAIFLAFARIAEGQPPDAEGLGAINRLLAEALPHLRLRPGEARCRWEWLVPEGTVDQMLWPVVRSAADLLTSERVERVRECASETCSWLFLDGSRNGRRKWCDMASCGNRAKARRYYERHHRG
ncbi:MAG TPA: CGNR zinc finger domain-containing protein [Thermoanaerobaculales bacterium]|nr:CGNR zinc finger domain-containing protein [Thermoanaerobaculales bacterium]HPA80350.1 CGNR zinc finger domain-containing protein [Thermoanaerobaculales bacterium]HQL29043.1 CGNR zinc finger domain-containing protein [Thermoanaerobaculales bacterium]HQN97035.1 CGNR zinc finger domain-containing protein [Thermoanaerobaculales bacterium]HQP42021.1 CGNR zinc finger domain-containing protein [Thermoanaerobaculales bacterium]